MSEYIGQKFNRWTVLKFAKKKNRKNYYQCQCECGFIKEQTISCLKRGESKQCKNCADKKNNIFIKKHGLWKTKTYKVWHTMKQRCQNVNTIQFYLYGGRGIKVCDKWIKFENFFADMGHAPKDHYLDRINPDGNYDPENCRWIHKSQNNKNRRNSPMYRKDYFFINKNNLCKECKIKNHIGE